MDTDPKPNHVSLRAQTMPHAYTHTHTHTIARQTGTTQDPNTRILVNWIVKQDTACPTLIGAFLQHMCVCVCVSVFECVCVPGCVRVCVLPPYMHTPPQIQASLTLKQGRDQGGSCLLLG